MSHAPTGSVSNEFFHQATGIAARARVNNPAQADLIAELTEDLADVLAAMATLINPQAQGEAAQPNED